MLGTVRLNLLLKFEKYRKEMKGLPWGLFYNDFKTEKYDPKKLEEEIIEKIIRPTCVQIYVKLFDLTPFYLLDEITDYKHQKVRSKEYNHLGKCQLKM